MKKPVFYFLNIASVPVFFESAIRTHSTIATTGYTWFDYLAALSFIFLVVYVLLMLKHALHTETVSRYWILGLIFLFGISQFIYGWLVYYPNEYKRLSKGT